MRAALAARSEPRALVVTDSVFSVDGDLAPLAGLHAACRDHGALLVVDEAHGLGVRGPGGRGLVHEAGLSGAADVVRTVTLSKSLGSQGGAVVAAEAVVEHLVDVARTFIFDTGLAPPAAGAALGALRVLRAEPERAALVRDRATRLAASIEAAAPDLRDRLRHPRRAGQGGPGRAGVPGLRRPRRLLPAAVGPRRDEPAAADRSRHAQ